MTIPVPELKDIDVAFGNISHLPAMEDIPDEFKDINVDNKWTKAQSDWFFKGIEKSQLVPKEGIDVDKAFQALAAIQQSFTPQHEHKRAGVAYLMSLWFKDYRVKEDNKNGK